jgi:hypothetical protein
MINAAKGSGNRIRQPEWARSMLPTWPDSAKPILAQAWSRRGLFRKLQAVMIRKEYCMLFTEFDDMI